MWEFCQKIIDLNRFLEWNTFVRCCILSPADGIVSDQFFSITKFCPNSVRTPEKLLQILKNNHFSAFFQNAPKTFHFPLTIICLRHLSWFLPSCCCCCRTSKVYLLKRGYLSLAQKSFKHIEFHSGIFSSIFLVNDRISCRKNRIISRHQS